MKLTSKHIGIVLNNIATALLHLSLFPDIMFLLNGLGYLGLLGAYFLPIGFFQQRHKLVWWIMFGYTILTILLWVIMGDKNFSTISAVGFFAKVFEIELLLFLWADKEK